MTHAPAVERPMLRRLAARLGVVDSYVDQTGGEVRHTSDLTRERLLAAMGYDVSTEERARNAWRTLRHKERSRLIEPVRVVRQASRTLSRVHVRMPATRSNSARWTLGLRTEEGTETHWSDVV